MDLFEILKDSWAFQDMYAIAEKDAKENVLKEGLEKGMQEGLEKGMQEGLEKGMQEGLEKGMQEGLEKGQVELLRQMSSRLIEKRFPSLQTLAAERLAMKATPAALENLYERLQDATFIDEAQELLSEWDGA